MRKLKIQFIGIHLLATMLLLIAFRQIPFLAFPELTEMYSSYGRLDIQSVELNSISNFLYVEFLASIVAILLGLAISLIIAKRKEVRILNSIIVLIIVFVILRSGILNWNFANKIAYFPGKWIHSDINIVAIFNIVFFSFFGILIFILASRQQNLK